MDVAMKEIIVCSSMSISPMEVLIRHYLVVNREITFLSPALSIISLLFCSEAKIVSIWVLQEVILKRLYILIGQPVLRYAWEWLGV